MKKVTILIVAMVVLISCVDLEEPKPNSCDCEYVTYENINNQGWAETYRSSWDATCEDELLRSWSYTTSNGTVTLSETYIECE